MKENGFIATSLIYSFFLIFIAIIAALLCNFIANKLVLTRYNEESQDSLNTNRYTVTLVSSGAECATKDQRGQTLYNLIRDGRFENLNSWWTRNGSVTAVQYNLGKPAVRLTNVSPYSYLSQKITRTYRDHKYYMSMEYAQNDSAPVQMYLYSTSPLITRSNGMNWTRTSNISEGMSNTNVNFVLGESYLNYSYVYITNVMLIDLTEHYGAGHEPSTEWLDENISYFEDTINFLKEEEIEGGESLEIKLVANKKELSRVSINCTSNNWIASTSNMSVTEGRTEDNTKKTTTLKLYNINDDISCTARWS